MKFSALLLLKSMRIYLKFRKSINLYNKEKKRKIIERSI